MLREHSAHQLTNFDSIRKGWSDDAGLKKKIIRFFRSLNKFCSPRHFCLLRIINQWQRILNQRGEVNIYAHDVYEICILMYYTRDESIFNSTFQSIGECVTIHMFNIEHNRNKIATEIEIISSLPFQRLHLYISIIRVNQSIGVFTRKFFFLLLVWVLFML